MTDTIGAAAAAISSFDVDETAAFIIQQKAQKVALQLPDSLLPYATSLLRELQARVPSSTKLFILADTSYGSCCVDEVAAQHSDADLIVHFGHACLSPTRRLAVRYCFPRNVSLSIDTFLTTIVEEAKRGTFTPAPSSTPSSSPTLPAALPRLLVFYSLEFEHAISSLSLQYDTHGGVTKYNAHLIFGHIQKQRATVIAPPSTTASSSPSTTVSMSTVVETKRDSNTPTFAATTSSSSTTATHGGVTDILGYEFAVPASHVADYSFLFITSRTDDPTLTTLFMNYTNHRVYTYNPSSSSSTPSSSCVRLETPSLNRTLGRRFYLVEKARNAKIIGIVVGTLGVASYLDVINQLKQTIMDAGKKSYLFAVGKINEPKLGNFPEIDLFVLVSCSQTSMVDSSKFGKDVITPVELHIALTPGSQWTGDYTTDFRDLLPDGRWTRREATERAARAANPPSDDDDNDTNTDGPRFSLINGAMQSSLAPRRANGAASRELITQTSTALSLIDPRLIPGAAHYAMTNRSWRGLDVNVERQDQHGTTIVGPATIEMGLDGIARGYAGEKGMAASTILTMQAAAAAVTTPTAATDATTTNTSSSSRTRSGHIELESSSSSDGTIRAPSTIVPKSIGKRGVVAKAVAVVTASSHATSVSSSEEVDDTSFRPDGDDFLDFL